MLAHRLAVLSSPHWLIVIHGIYVVSQCIYHLSLANHPRFFAIILILILLLMLNLLMLILIHLMFQDYIYQL
jgi:hypothetical protein